MTERMNELFNKTLLDARNFLRCLKEQTVGAEGAQHSKAALGQGRCVPALAVPLPGYATRSKARVLPGS